MSSPGIDALDRTDRHPFRWLRERPLLAACCLLLVVSTFFLAAPRLDFAASFILMIGVCRVSLPVVLGEE